MLQTKIDHVAVGAGSAGEVIAVRLSGNPKRRVLLLGASEQPNNVGIYIARRRKTANEPRACLALLYDQG